MEATEKSLNGTELLKYLFGGTERTGNKSRFEIRNLFDPRLHTAKSLFQVQCNWAR